MSNSSFDASYAGIAALLRSPMIGEHLLSLAEKVKERAEDLAPVSETSDHPGRYKASFETELGTKRGRAEAIVRNTSPEAIYVEKGTSFMDGQDVLMRALDALKEL